MKKTHLFTILLLLITVGSFAQQNGFGAIFDVDSISKIPQKISLSFRSFQSLPPRASLEEYCPIPGNQQQFGTCVAWSNAYGVNTILYAKTHNLTNKTTITKYAFSPTFVYELIKAKDDANCQSGSHPVSALEIMKQAGAPLLSKLPYACGVKLTDDLLEFSVPYAIKDYNLLYAAKGFSKDDIYLKNSEEIIDAVKKALSEGCPVSGGFRIPRQFAAGTDGVWAPASDWKDETKWKHGLHAMAVVGYDDNVAGGAFRVLNSWGTGWGDKGYIWMKYADFVSSTIMGIQVFANPNTPVPEEAVKPKPEPKPQPKPEPKPQPKPEPRPEPKPEPKPKPAPSEQTFVLSGNVEFKLNTGDDMPIKKTSTRNLVVEDDEPAAKEDLVAYTMADTYASGTKFRFYLNVDKESYVYAFATDLTGKVNLILPFADNISTLVGSNSTIAFPSDTKIIKMDENKGRDYLLILYSATSLDAKAMVQKMNSMKGALSDKIKQVLGNKLIDKSKIEYSKDRVGFSTKKLSTRNLTVEDDDKPTPTGGSVVPLMVEIKHN